VIKNREKQNKPISLSDCFDEFSVTEKFSEDNLWYCGKCKDHVRAEKKMTLWKLPKILVLHLKRFQNIYNKWRKSNRLVKFPLVNLDFAPFLDSERRKENNDASLSYDLHVVLVRRKEIHIFIISLLFRIILVSSVLDIIQPMPRVEKIRNGTVLMTDVVGKSMREKWKALLLISSFISTRT